MAISYKVKIHLPNDREFHSWVYKKKKKSECPQRDLYPNFIAALVTITKNWKQPTCHPLTEQKTKLHHVYAIEYPSSVRGSKY